MEKFAEHYWKCNPRSFTSADTAYVLAYSVIMLNTNAHNNMVKDKIHRNGMVMQMTKADFICNNRGIDDGKDLPEEYLGSLYDRVVKEEIKMNSDTLAPQNKQVNGLNKLLGLDGILNLVSWMQPDEKPHGANGRLIRDIQEQFPANFSLLTRLQICGSRHCSLWEKCSQTSYSRADQKFHCKFEST
ncbi:PREDICTED: brefeldin A-inhibited guanine nucleotide-exchange protein 4-like isoform X2 [Camelina sativa]|nr:PREDICTED: brefeldin A-inhibited guanine nucleotide-exchange protein 4-like isoform X2 [Camelina sativa]